MPWWGKPKDPEPEQPKASKDESEKTFDPDKLPAKEKLPKALQKIVDKADADHSFFDNIVEG